MSEFVGGLVWPAGFGWLRGITELVSWLVVVVVIVIVELVVVLVLVIALVTGSGCSWCAGRLSGKAIGRLSSLYRTKRRPRPRFILLVAP